MPAGPSDLRPRPPHITISEFDTHSVFSEIDTDTLFSEFDADSLFSEVDVDAVFSEFEDDTTFPEIHPDTVFSKTFTIEPNTMPTTSTPASDNQDTQTSRSTPSHYRMQLNNWLQVNGGTSRFGLRIIRAGPEHDPTYTAISERKSPCEPRHYRAEPVSQSMGSSMTGSVPDRPRRQRKKRRAEFFGR